MKLIVETNHKEFVEEVHSFIAEWNSDSTYITTSTSGSTGNSKLIQIPKEYMIASAKMTGDFLNLKPNKNALLCLSPKTIGGKMMIVRAIVWNMNLIVTDLNSTPLSAIRSKIDFAAMVPLQVSNSLKNDSNKLKNIDIIIIGGGPMNPQLEHTLQAFPNSIYHTFGMTETISHVALKCVTKNEISYTALPNISFTVEEKRLVINAPELGIKNLKTTDSVELINSQSFIWKGRLDFIINSGGIKLSPEEIEKKLSSIVKDPFFITALPDNLLGEKIILVIESKTQSVSKSDLNSILAKFEIPKDIYFLSSFIRTESGKISRKETLNSIVDA